MRYKSQAYIGVIGCVGLALFLVVMYSQMTEVHFAVPLFSIPFMIGFAYYSYASLKEGREVREKRRKEKQDKKDGR